MTILNGLWIAPFEKPKLIESITSFSEKQMELHAELIAANAESEAKAIT